MSFFFDSIEIPFWFIVFLLSSAMPIWIKWYKIFHKKFIVTGILQKKFRKAKTAAEMKMDVFNKATEHWNTQSELSAFPDSIKKKRNKVKNKIDPDKKENILQVLKVLASAGEAGILPKSISDKTNINTRDTNSALTYLIEKEYVEEINSTNGTKYYLTKLGVKYCINKKFISDS